MKKVREVFGVRPVNGTRVGIELEFEGDRLPPEELLMGWKRVEDGSLRPPCGEYVLKKPLDVESSYEAVDHLYDVMAQCRTKLRDTVRAGVHVHVNCQELTITQLYSFMTLYLLMEEALVEWCGESRIGNLFCLRAGDAEELLHQIENATKDLRFRNRFHTDDLRYASMNVKALTQYGSLEFRAMKSTGDRDTLKKWVGMLMSVFDASQQYRQPNEIIEEYSILSGVALLKKVFGNVLSKDLMHEGVEEMLFNGMRNAQEVAYATNWEELEERINKPNTNPFDPPDEYFMDIDVAIPKPQPAQAIDPELDRFLRMKKLMERNEEHAKKELLVGNPPGMVLNNKPRKVIKDW